MSTGAETIQEGVQVVRDEAEARAAEAAQEAIEQAQARAEAAQAMAQQVTDAALQTELGRQIRATNEKVEQCQAALATQSIQLQQLLADLAALTARLPVIQVSPDQSSSIRRTSAKPSAEAISPEDQAAADDVDADDQEGRETSRAPARKGRRII